MATFVIQTLGCKVNQFESEGIANYLVENGWERKVKNADVCIINTCTVTENASKQSKTLIRNIVRNNSNSRVIVTGCFAEISGNEIRNMEGVTDVIGHFDKQIIPKLILESIKDLNTDIADKTVFKEMPGSSDGMRTRPFLKIQDGCDSYCSYCIVPYTRGRSRSLEFEKVIEKIKDYSEKGYLETVISGIHVGKYGQDLKEKTSLKELVKHIDENKLISRLRLGSVEPKEIDDDFIKILKSSDIIAKHLHIPLQSGDSYILERMERPYDRIYFRDLIEKIYDEIPGIAIGTDIMVGFPGEDEKAFENSYNLISELPLSYIHVFPFSKREGTKAWDFEDEVPAEEIKRRAELLRELGAKKRDEYQRSFSKKVMKVLVERKRDSKTGLLKGLTSNYINVLAEGDDSLMNTITEFELLFDENEKVMRGRKI